jgi:hypothetical protein
VSVVCRIRVSGDPPCPPIASTLLPSILGSNCQRGRSPRNQHEPIFRFLTHPRFSIQSFVLQGIGEGVDRTSCRGGLVRCVSGARAERCGSRLKGLRGSDLSRVERCCSVVEISSTSSSNAVIRQSVEIAIPQGPCKPETISLAIKSPTWSLYSSWLDRAPPQIVTRRSSNSCSQRFPEDHPHQVSRLFKMYG